MESETFLVWFRDVFLNFTSSLSGEKILFLDGHTSHISIPLTQFANEHNVTIMCIPAHTSHALQPLDVGEFNDANTIGNKRLAFNY